ncbi:MAG: para-aminobenzoate synthetase component II [Candidatus Magnetoglobus multicellularis str. Araruama]|uniref:Para-aminobenzoate synthetase component II n=1 Tax=Candidatus Magnetoglobus multicellularis str. Araruama TaxID=890399 RepID=A0A1V1P2A7_9BACT|nr:MAG: para-aminobenzoate synthetase component II [Candidatus Magnetoglobus multicellularis str. Araruama]
MIILIDNYDSFTYNIAYALGTLGQELRVFRSDVITTDEIDAMQPQAIMISPGPGRPENSGISCETIERFSGKIPILGVCLGHQCIGQVFGGKVIQAEIPVHGKTSSINHDGNTIFKNIPNAFKATRYHSLIVEKSTLPSQLSISAQTDLGMIMGVRNELLMVEGVQFHPESIATTYGTQLFKNFLELYL